MDELASGMSRESVINSFANSEEAGTSGFNSSNITTYGSGSQVVVNLTPVEDRLASLEGAVLQVVGAVNSSAETTSSATIDSAWTTQVQNQSEVN